MKVTHIFQSEQYFKMELPLVTANISAGFPSPADDFIDTKLDLNELMIKHPSATFFVRVSGDSMINAGINDGDILVVDRSLEAKDKDIIIAALEGELTVKRMRLKPNPKFQILNTKQIQNSKYQNSKNNRTMNQLNNASTIILLPENPDYEPIEVTEDTDFAVWGVVTFVIHRV